MAEGWGESEGLGGHWGGARSIGIGVLGGG